MSGFITFILKYSFLCRLSLIDLFLQTEWIRQNCAIQMERVRDNYNNQIQNLRDIRQYGSVQLHGVRDQYYDQVSFPQNIFGNRKLRCSSIFHPNFSFVARNKD